MKGLVVDCKTGKQRIVEDDLPVPPYTPQHEYELAKSVTLAPDLKPITIKSTIFRFDRKLTVEEEKALETLMDMKVIDIRIIGKSERR